MDSIEPAILHVLLLGVLPLWLIAGLADYGCHWRQDIAHSSGPLESVLHLLMIGEVGFGVVLAMLFEPTALVIGILIALCAMHLLTAMVDSVYASRHRAIGPFEQHVHSFLDACPLVGVLLLALLDLEQASALFGIGEGDADVRLSLRDPLPPAWLISSVLGAGALLSVAPFAQELMRAIRAKTHEGAAPFL